MDRFLRLLRTRARELHSALDAIDKGNYDTTDKEIMRRTVGQELKWAEHGIVGVTASRSQ